MIFTAVFELLLEAAAVIAGCEDSSASLQIFTVVCNVQYLSVCEMLL